MVRNGQVSSLFRLLLLPFPPSFVPNSCFFFLLDPAPALMASGGIFVKLSDGTSISKLP